jgi:AraC-like DNA-binding protein
MPRRRKGVHDGSSSARFLNRLIDEGVAAGVSRPLLLAAAGLREADLANPDARVPLAAEVAAWRTLARLVADPGFAVRMGSRIRLRSSGLFGYVVGFSPTLRDSLLRVQRYGRVLSDASRWDIEEDGDLILSLARPTIGLRLPFAEDYRQAAVVQSTRDLTGVGIVPRAVSFTYAEPATTLAHREFFRAPLRFGQPRASIIFAARDLQLPVTRGDETLAGYLVTHAERELTLMRRMATTTERVRAAIRSLKETRPPIQRVAVALGIPARTLQRRLAAERTTYHRELEQILMAVAIGALRDPTVAIEDVASLLGYSEPSAFYRSFKRWTGATPAHYRAA